MRVSPAQALAFRVGAQQLATRDADPLAVLGGWGVQDSPPGAAAGALAARTEPLAADWLDRALHVERTAVALYNPRTATAILPAADLSTFAAGLLPPDEASLRFVLGRALPGEEESEAGSAPGEDQREASGSASGEDQRETGHLASDEEHRGGGAAVISPDEAVALAVAAVEQALDGRTLSRDELHEELRRALPPALLPWCPGCESHHARRGLLVLASLHGRLCLAGREGRQPRFARTDQWLAGAGRTDGVDRDSAAAEVVRRYLRGCGPSTPQLFAQWAGIAPHHARRSWELVAGELVELELEGCAAQLWLLEEDVERLRDPAPAGGVRLLPPGDPLLLARDRELLIEDPAVRRRAWSATGSPGLLLLDGQPRALWRGRKKGRRLEVTLEPFGRPLPKRALTQVEAEVQRLAPHRGCSSATVALTGAER